MAENPSSELQNPGNQNPVSAPLAPELRFEGFHGGNGFLEDEDRKRDASDLRALSTVGSNPAKYKSMSPARLPITRSPCLTIPPGLSPTTLLDSPVLLSNAKAEPSPTTGSFSMPLGRHVSLGSDSLSLPRDTPNNSSCDEGSSRDFEFKPHTGSGSGSSLSSLGHLASGSDYQQIKPFAQVQGQFQQQKFSSSPPVTLGNVRDSSDESSLSISASIPPVYMATSMARASSEVIPNESHPKQGSDGCTQSILSDQKGTGPLALVDKSSEDGYNWRKYGQKHVKGSEFPRSYYKCTHPNCQVKKQLERSHDGHVTEIIYKGTHDHPKPLPGRRLALGAILSNQTEERSDGFSSLMSAEDKSMNTHGQLSHQIGPSANPEHSPVSPSDDDIDGVGARSNKIGDDVDDDDDPEFKRRKTDIGGMDVTSMVKATREPRVVVQTLSEVDILDDGYRWRKYGQKVVKGNPNPRSYYKCTNSGCPVRKHVERASHDPKAVITTYEGKHNHDVPAARTSSHDTAVPTIPNNSSSLNSHMSAALNSMLRTDDTAKVMPHCFDRSDENKVLSLDLGVGIGSSPENRTSERQQTPGTMQGNTQIEIAGSGCSKLIQAAPVSTFYGSLSEDHRDRYGSSDGLGGSFSFKIPTLNHTADPYRQNIGRMVMGP